MSPKLPLIMASSDPENQPELVFSSDDIPSILDNLSSDNELFDEAIRSLKLIAAERQGLATEHLLTQVPEIIQLTYQSSDETRRSSLIEVLSLVLAASDGGVKEHITDLVAFLCGANSLGRHSLVSAFEATLEKDDETFEETLVDLFKDKVYDIPDYDDESQSHDYKKYTSVIETFEHTLIYGQSRCRNAAIKAGILNYLVMSTFAPEKATRLAAVSCMIQVFGEVDDLLEHVPDKDKLHLQGWIVIPLLDLINDDDAEVSKTVVDFFYGNDDTAEFFWAYERAAVALVSKLARRDPRATSGSLCEWTLSKYISEDKSTIAEGFRTFWAKEDVTLDTKLNLVAVLGNTLSGVRGAAASGGAIEFMETIVKGQDTVNAVLVLSAIDKAGQEDIQFGHYLLKANAIPWLMSVAHSSSTELRRLAHSILRRLIQSYATDEYSPLREDVLKILTAAETLPIIVSNTHDDDPTISDSALRLLSEILSEDSKVTKYSPHLSSIIDRPVIDLAIQRLDETGPSIGALEFLSRIFEGYPSSSLLVQEALTGHIPVAPIEFFASLNPDYDDVEIEAWDPRVHIWEVALQTGALPRILGLVEESFTTVESRRAAVRAIRGVLSAKNVDRDIGRTNEHLSRLFAELIASETADSVVEASRLVSLLVDVNFPGPFRAWAALMGNEETVTYLAKILATQPESLEKPAEEGVSIEKYEGDLAEYEKRVKESTEKFEFVLVKTLELIQNLLPIFMPYTSQLAFPLLRLYVTHDQSVLLEILESLAASTSLSDLEPLVDAARQLLTGESLPPPFLDRLSKMISSSRKLAFAFYLAGLAPYLTNLVEANAAAAQLRIEKATGDDEEDSDPVNTAAALEIFSALILHLRGQADPAVPAEYLRDVQTRILQCGPLVKACREKVEEGDAYGLQSSESYIMASDLLKLGPADGY